MAHKPFNLGVFILTARSHRQTNFFGNYLSALVLLAIFTNAYELNAGNFVINPERIIVLPLLLVAVLINCKEYGFPMPKSSAFLLITWLTWALFASYCSDVMAWSVKMWALLCVASSYYFIVIFLKTDPFILLTGKVFTVFAWLFGPVVVSFYFWFLLHGSLPEPLYFWIQEGSGGGARVRASIIESNLYASYLVLPILCILALNKRKKLLWWFLLASLHLALICSFSRLPWAAYLVGLAVYCLLLSPGAYDPRKATKVFLVLFAVFLFVGLLILLAFIEYGHYEILGRVGSITTRFFMVDLAVQDIVKHPIIGNGMFSLSELYPNASFAVGSDSYRSVWISNLFLAVLHDTGCVGLVLFVSFFLKVLQKGARKVRRSILLGGQSPQSTRITAALVSTGVSLIVSGMSIPAHSMGFFWVVFALIERASILMNQGPLSEANELSQCDPANAAISIK